MVLFNFISFYNIALKYHELNLILVWCDFQLPLSVGYHSTSEHLFQNAHFLSLFLFPFPSLSSFLPEQLYSKTVWWYWKRQSSVLGEVAAMLSQHRVLCPRWWRGQPWVWLLTVKCWSLSVMKTTCHLRKRGTLHGVIMWTEHSH